MTTRCGLLLALPGNSLKGHEERFPATRLSAGYGFRKETLAGTRPMGETRREPSFGPPKVQRAGRPGANTHDFGCARRRG